MRKLLFMAVTMGLLVLGCLLFSQSSIPSKISLSALVGPALVDKEAPPIQVTP